MPNLVPNPEITDFEKKTGITIPGFYRKLLVAEGTGLISPNTDLLPLHDMFRNLDPSRVSQVRFFPFAIDKRTGKFWIMDSASDDNCALVDKVADIASVSDKDWLTPEEWLLFLDEDDKAVSYETDS